MKYIPAGPDDRRRLLREVGAVSIDDLFSSIPEPLRFRGPLPVEPALSDPELEEMFGAMAADCAAAGSGPFFLGAGAYRHYRPAPVDALISRAEFYTSYTPYQPEVSQGTLQALFEYQTLICQLTEMEVANASLYDGGSALAEAVLMARRLRPSGAIAVSSVAHPHHLQVADTYARHLGPPLTRLPRRSDGTTGTEAIAGRAGDLAAVVVQTPNFLGCLEPLDEIAAAAHAAGALLVVSIGEPVALGLVRGPGHFGADIVAGEGQALGLPLSFGGPFVGFIACRESHVRAMPGRIVGETRDVEGRRGYVLTLATREQHIRRERATSNICTNQGLCALAMCVHMSLLGRRGLLRLARLNAWRAREALARLEAVAGARRAFAAPFFNEFTLELDVEAEEACRTLAQRGIVAGLPLSRHFPELRRHLLVCATEMARPADVETLAGALGALSARGAGAGRRA
jgi:glycine dehydrogenase subunit 1